MGYAGAAMGYAGATMGYVGATMGMQEQPWGDAGATMGYAGATMGVCRSSQRVCRSSFGCVQKHPWGYAGTEQSAVGICYLCREVFQATRFSTLVSARKEFFSLLRSTLASYFFKVCYTRALLVSNHLY